MDDSPPGIAAASLRYAVDACHDWLRCVAEDRPAAEVEFWRSQAESYVGGPQVVELLEQLLAGDR